MTIVNFPKDYTKLLKEALRIHDEALEDLMEMPSSLNAIKLRDAVIQFEELKEEIREETGEIITEVDDE